MYIALVANATTRSVAAFFVSSVAPTWNAAVTSTVTVFATRAGVPTATESHVTLAATAAEFLSAAAKSAGVSVMGHASDGRVNDAETVTFAAVVTAESTQVSVDAEAHETPETSGQGYPVRSKSFASAQVPPPLAGVLMLRAASQVPPSHVVEHRVVHANALITQSTVDVRVSRRREGRVSV